MTNIMIREQFMLAFIQMHLMELTPTPNPLVHLQKICIEIHSEDGALSLLGMF